MPLISTQFVRYDVCSAPLWLPLWVIAVIFRNRLSWAESLSCCEISAGFQSKSRITNLKIRSSLGHCFWLHIFLIASWIARENWESDCRLMHTRTMFHSPCLGPCNIRGRKPQTIWTTHARHTEHTREERTVLGFKGSWTGCLSAPISVQDSARKLTVLKQGENS